MNTIHPRSQHTKGRMLTREIFRINFCQAMTTVKIHIVPWQEKNSIAYRDTITTASFTFAAPSTIAGDFTAIFFNGACATTIILLLGFATSAATLNTAEQHFHLLGRKNLCGGNLGNGHLFHKK